MSNGLVLADTTNNPGALIDILALPISIGSGGTGATTLTGLQTSLGIATTSAINTYSAGDISIGTTNDGSYVDVDATNAKITFTVSVVGRYLVTCNFSTETTGTVSLALSSRVSFRLTDSTNNSNPVKGGTTIPLVLLFISSFATPYSVFGTFDFATTGSKTIKLQKKNIVSTNIGARVVQATSDSCFSIVAYKISD